jgi:hypothetical protein
MIIHPSCVGCDISKDHLDIFDERIGKVERIANEASALAPLIERWKGQDLLVLFEATGSYDRCLRRALADAAGSGAGVVCLKSGNHSVLAVIMPVSDRGGLPDPMMVVARAGVGLIARRHRERHHRLPTARRVVWA